MRLLVVLACVLAGCLAQTPHPCKSPPLLTGAFSVVIQKEQLAASAQYEYDALGQRVRLREVGVLGNQTFTYDVLVLYREAIVYEINYHDQTCKKKPLKVNFHPWEIPSSASLLAQVVLGSSSGPGEGLLVNTWIGELPDKAGRYFGTVTEFGCIPVNTLYQTEQYGFVLLSFFNNVIGILDPSALNPPKFCQQAVDSAEEQVDLLSLFFKGH